MSLLPTVLQSQTTYSTDAVQNGNDSYYFVLTGDASGGGTGNTVTGPFTVIANPADGADILIAQPEGYNNAVIAVGDASGTYTSFLAGSGGGPGIIQLGDTREIWTSIVGSPQNFTLSSIDPNGTQPNKTYLNYDQVAQSLTLSSPTLIDTTDASSGINNGITINCDRSNNFPYGIVIEDITDPTENIAVLVAEGDTGILQLGNSGAANAFFSSSPASVVIGSTDLTNTTTNVISWDPTVTPPTLKLNNPVVVTGPSGDGVIYDSIYNPPPSNPPVPIITSPTAPITLASWADNLAPEGSTPYTVPATGLYLVTASVRIGVGVAYSFPAGSILNLTPTVSGTQDPYNSMTFFLSSTAPQGNINTTQSGLGFYVQGDTIVGTLNQASTGSINLGAGGSAEMLIQQVINQYP